MKRKAQHSGDYGFHPLKTTLLSPGSNGDDTLSTSQRVFDSTACIDWISESVVEESITVNRLVERFLLMSGKSIASSFYFFSKKKEGMSEFYWWMFQKW